MLFVIGGRTIVLRKGTKTQTVRIRRESNQPGQYDYVLRMLLPADEVTPQEIQAHATVEALVEWLKTIKHAEPEAEPIAEVAAAPPTIPPTIPPPPESLAADDWWIRRAKTIVDQAIDQLVLEFLRAPYLHRVEHSLHARLWAILAAQPHFDRELPLGDSPAITQPIHKEWPEAIPEEGSRRGSFDLAVLSPALLKTCSIEDFQNGKLTPPIAIEMGLDYGAVHLGKDIEKLLHSRIGHAYVVHFTRKADDNRAEDLIRNPGGGGSVRIAFASVFGGRQRYKLIGSEGIETYQA